MGGDGLTRCPTCGATSKDPSVLDMLPCRERPKPPREDGVMSRLGLKPERVWHGPGNPMRASIGDLWRNPDHGLVVGIRNSKGVDLWCHPTTDIAVCPAVLDGYNPLVRKVVVSDRIADIPYSDKDQERLYLDVMWERLRDAADQHLEEEGFILVDGYAMKMDRDREPGFLHMSVEGIARPWREGI